MVTGTFKSLALEADTMTHYGQNIDLLGRANITLHSAMYGLVNNGIQLGKWAGITDESTKEWDLVDDFNKHGDMDLAIAYGKSRASYNLAGDLLGSLVPGTLALKGIKLIKNAGTIGKYVGWFDGRANKIREEIQTAYKLNGSTADVRSLKFKLMGAVGAQQFVEGALVTGAVDATLNYGDILNNEGLTALEKVSKIGTNLAVGGVLNGAIGGFFDYRKLKGLTEVALKDAQEVENQFMPRAISSRVGNLPTKTDAAHKLVMAVGQFDAIDAMSTASQLEVSAKARGLDILKTDINTAIGELFPKSDKSEYASVLRDFLHTSVQTPEGRQAVAAQFANVRKFEYSSLDVFDQSKLIDDMLDSVELTRIGKQDLLDIRNKSPSGLWDGEAIIAREEFGAGKKVFVTEELSDDLASRQAIAAHASIFKVAPAKLQKFEDDLTKFAIDAGLPVNTSLHTVLTKFYDYARMPGSAPSTKFPGVADYFNTIGNDASLAIYGKVSRSYLDSYTKTVRDSPIKHIGDLKDFSYHEASGTVVLSKVGTASAKSVDRVLTLKDVSKLDSTVDLHDYQALRLIAGSRISDVPKVALDKMSVSEMYKVEGILSRAKSTDTMVKIGEKTYQRAEVVDAIAKTKGREYERLTAALPDESADDIYNSIGYMDNSQTIGILAASKEGSKAVAESEIIRNPALLSSKRTITVLHDRPQLDFNGLSAAAIGESIYASQLATQQAVGLKMLGLGSPSDMVHLPKSLQIEFPHGIENRWHAAVPVIGDYGGLVQQAGRIGSWLMRTAETVFNANIAPALKHSGTSLAANSAASAEYLALRAWYYGQTEKFVSLGNGLVVRADLAPEIKAALATGESEATTLRGLIRGTQYMKLETQEAQYHLDTVQKLNRGYIANKKLQANAAWGNTDSFDLEALYFPPRDMPFSTFIVEPALGPLDQTSERMYLVSANTRDELETKVRAAMAHSDKNGLRWSRRDTAQIKEFQQARGKYEWSSDLEGGYAKSAMQRLGAIEDLTPETDVHKVLVDEMDWFKRSNVQVHRAGVELLYSDDISKLNTLSRMEEAQMRTQLSNKEKLPLGAYGQIMHTMLGSDAQGFSLWKLSNNVLEDWTSAALSKINQSIKSIRSSGSKVAAIEEQTKLLEDELAKAGMKMPMADAVAERLAREYQVKPEDIRGSVSFLNHLQATLLLRLDWTDAGMNLLGNMVKTGGEMQFLKSIYAKSSPEVKQAFDKEVANLFGVAQTTDSFGGTLTFKHVGKVYKDVIAKLWTEEGAARIADLTERRYLVSNEKAIVEMFQEARIKPDMFKQPAEQAAWRKNTMKGLTKLYELGVKPSDTSAMVNQLVALEIAERLGKAVGMSADQLDTFMYSFNGRVNAIYDSFQKPRLFQGSAGIALSLYQGYMFHMMSNMFRYADKNVNAANGAVIALNSLFFGAQALPGYQYINENIVGAHTKGHADINSVVGVVAGQDVNGRDLADFIMYGAGSMLLQGNMSVRGGMTPRSPILIPSSIQDVPLAQSLVKTIASATESAHQIMYGAPIVSSLWDGLVNTGLSRPLVGLNTVLTGKSLDNNYNNVMYHEDMFSIPSAIRLVGMKPLNEQIARDQQSRFMFYKAHDAELKKALGKEIRILKDKQPDAFNSPELVRRLGLQYMKAGGSAANFDSFLQDQLVKGRDDLYDRLEDTITKSSDRLSTFRDVYGGY